MDLNYDKGLEFDKYLFKNKPEEYKNRIDPLKHYGDITSYFISKLTSKPIDDSKTLLKTYIKEKKHFKIPRVLFYERELEKDRSKKTDNLLNYIMYPIKTGNIIVPSFTVYFSPKIKESLHSAFIDNNVKRRNLFKKLAFKCKMDGDWTGYNNNNNLQKTMKILNNALSGSYASASTVLYNPSAHYTLTSITRVVSGIGNAITEAIVAGNKHFRTPEETYNHIVTLSYIAENELYEEIVNTVKRHNLHLPTVYEVIEYIKLKSNFYWQSLPIWKDIEKFLGRVDGYVRAFILYHLNLHSLRLFNEEVIREFMDRSLNYTIIDAEEKDYDYLLDEIPDWFYNLTIHMFVSKIKGKKRDDFTFEDKKLLASFVHNMKFVFEDYKDIIKTFFVTHVFPPSISKIKEMVRESIVLSDTDSTCGCYQDWVLWYNKGKLDFTDKSIGVAAIIMTITTQVLDHYIKTFATNMNIPYDRAKALAMKNEFFWDIFANTDVSKHYFANVVVQEMNAYDLPPKKTLEKKGVHLKASTVYYKVRERSEDMMVEIFKDIKEQGYIELNKYINLTTDIENLLIRKIKEGSPDILKLEKVKEAKAYKNDPYHSPYFFYMLWEKVFSKDKGHAPQPPFMAIKIPTKIENKTDMKKFLSTLPEDKRKAIEELLIKGKKDKISAFKLPLMNVYEKGIPDELKDWLDVNRVVRDNTSVLYMILSSLSYYVKDGYTLSKYYDVIEEDFIS